MKRLFGFLFFIAVVTFIMQSCIDKDYDWDDMDKSGVLKIPPIPLGSDTVYLEGLPEIIPGGISLPIGSIALTDTIKGLFEGDAIEDFFFDGADPIKITSDMEVKVQTTGVTLTMYFHIINQQNERIEEIKIKEQPFSIGKNQKLEIEIASQYMKYMENARDLQFTIVIDTKNNPSFWIGPNDFIAMTNAIVQTGGYHFEL